MKFITRSMVGFSYLFVVIALLSTLLTGEVIETLAGSQAAPALIEIENCSQLQAMKNDLSGQYILVNSIDCTTSAGWNAGLGFEPVGDLSNEFTGTFDGYNHSITGLFINRPSDYYVGLFGYTGSGVEIKNVHLDGINVTGQKNVGGLTGSNQGAITNATSAGSVSATMGAVGGLVGYNNADIKRSYSSATISGAASLYYAGGLVGENRGLVYQSHASGAVTGEESVGGLVGMNSSGTISQCYATGIVTGGNGKSGGLVGRNAYNNATIVDSYAAGPVNGGTGAYAAAGGLLGSNGGTGWGTETVDNSYSVGKVSGDDAGGLVGWNSNAPGTITDSYWDLQTSGTAISGAGVGRNTDQMFQQANYAGWDFGAVWSIEEDRIYPWHKWEPETHSQLVSCEDSGQQNFYWSSSDTWGILRECTINVPTSGQVFISADAIFAYQNGEYEALAGIGIDSQVGDPNISRWVSVYDHPPGGEWNPLALSTVKPIDPGIHTIYLVATRYLGAPDTTVKVWDSTLSVIFIPASDTDLMACGVSGYNEWTTTSSSFGVMRQCTLDLPSHGWVYISADATADLANLNYEALFNLSIDSTIGEYRIDRWLDVYADPSGDTDKSFSLAGLLPVPAGEHTFYLLGKRLSGTGMVRVYDSTLNVLYFPAPSITTASCGVVENDTWTTTSSSMSVVRQCTIDVPENSQVFISANASLNRFVNDSAAHFQLSIDNSSVGDSNADRFVDLSTDGINDNDKNLALTRILPINSGPHTFYLLGRRYSGSGTTRVFDSTLSVLVLREPDFPEVFETILPLVLKSP